MSQKFSFKSYGTTIGLIVLTAIISLVVGLMWSTPVKQVITENKIDNLDRKQTSFQKTYEEQRKEDITRQDAMYEKAIVYIDKLNEVYASQKELSIKQGENISMVISSVARLTENMAVINADNARIKAYLDIKQNEENYIRNYLYDRQTDFKYNPYLQKLKQDSLKQDSVKIKK